MAEPDQTPPRNPDGSFMSEDDRLTSGAEAEADRAFGVTDADREPDDDTA